MPRSTSRRLIPVLQAVRQRWSAEEAGAVLNRLESSGLSVRKFAAREGLNPLRLYRWRARLASPPTAPAFVEIKATAATTIEVVFRTGHVVRVPDGFDEDTFRRVAAILDGQGARC